MLIGIDGNEANLTQNRVGINQYAFYLIHALHSLATDHQFIIYLKSAPLNDLPQEKSNWRYRVIPFPKLWTQTRLPWDLYTHSPRPDVFFSATHYAPRFSPVPTVVAIMDLGFLDTPEQFTAKDFNQLKNWTAYSVRNASKVIAISEFTKSAVIKTYHKADTSVVVTPLAYDKKLFMPVKDAKIIQPIMEKYSLHKPYIFFLSSLKPSKNVEGLVRAFAKLNKPDLQLVIAGKKAWLYDRIFTLVKDLKLENRVVFTGFIPEIEVPALMTASEVFALPSFHEGFGIPVLEAMACGTPLVISKVASLPEVAGDAAVYIDPRSSDSIVKGLREAISRRSFFVKKGLERVKLFDWSKTAQMTLEAIESAARH